MEELLELIRLLERSVEINGEIPLTNVQLLNILQKTRRNIDFKSKKKLMDDDENYWDILNPNQ